MAQWDLGSKSPGCAGGTYGCGSTMAGRGTRCRKRRDRPRGCHRCSPLAITAPEHEVGNEVMQVPVVLLGDACYLNAVESLFGAALRSLARERACTGLHSLL
mmetsp:Transcript_47660/g.132630  ORF Transcript_47660/g.132630 Transcript_47660/m.132630 type:complete len:102 (-) Transcript_47660:484-789(-)